MSTGHMVPADPVPFPVVTLSDNTSGSFSIGGAIAGTAPVYPLPPVVNYPANSWISMSGPVRWISDADIKALADECSTRVRGGDTLVLRPAPGITAAQRAQLAGLLRELGVFTLLLENPAVVSSGADASTAQMRLGVLARLALIWEQNPRLRLGDLLARVVCATPGGSVSDETFIAAVEVTFGP